MMWIFFRIRHGEKMKIYITKVEKADFEEFLEVSIPLLTEERREKTRNYKNDSDRVTSAAAELLLSFAIDEQVMSGSSLFTDKENGWEVYTMDGKPSAQWEYQIYVTEEGVEVISY